MTPSARAAGPAAGLPWARVALVLAVIGAAHLGLYLLLTASVRRDVADAEARYGPETLAGATRPGPLPSGDGAVAAWHRHQAVWEAHETWTARRGLARTLGGALLASFLMQVGLTGWMLARVRKRARRRGAAAPASG